MALLMFNFVLSFQQLFGFTDAMQAPFCMSIKTLGLRIPGAQFLRESAKFAKTSIVFEGACFSECHFNFLGLIRRGAVS